MKVHTFAWSKPLGLPILLGALRDESPVVRKAAAEAIQHNVGPDSVNAIPALRDALKSGDPEIASRVPAILGRIGGAEVIVILLDELREPERKNRTQIISALAWSARGTPDSRVVVEELVRLLKQDPIVDVQATMSGLRILGAGAESALPVLNELSTGRDGLTRKEAAETRGVIEEAISRRPNRAPRVLHR